VSPSRLTLTRLQVSISLVGVVLLLPIFSLNPVAVTKSRRKPSPPKASPAIVAARPTATTPAVTGRTRTIVLNSGYDQGLPTPALIDVGKLDNEWRVISDTVNGRPQPPATGRPADIVPDSSWNLNPLLATNFPSSRWISVTGPQGQPLPIPLPTNKFQYAYYFTLPDGFTNPVLTMKLLADDRIAKVTLNSTILFQGATIVSRFLRDFYLDPVPGNPQPAQELFQSISFLMNKQVFRSTQEEEFQCDLCFDMAS